MSYVKLDLHEGDTLEIGRVPVAVTWARGRRCVLLIPQYEVIDGVQWPMLEEHELRFRAAGLRIDMDLANKRKAEGK